jgi:hypothetical protein
VLISMRLVAACMSTVKACAVVRLGPTHLLPIILELWDNLMSCLCGRGLTRELQHELGLQLFNYDLLCPVPGV